MKEKADNKKNKMINRIDIINLSHCDMGFTDHPEVCRRLQVKYIDRALALCLDNAGQPKDKCFFWTIESNAALADWWRGAGRKARGNLVQAVEAGWMEVCAMPFNNTPLMNARQWNHVVRWLPDDLWKKVNPRVIMQSDVNGMPRAGVMALMDKGAEFLWMSINPDTGGSPLSQPAAFWWRMPDGRKIFVWNSIHYAGGYFLFETDEWRKGPVPKASDTRYREPVRGDFFKTTPENLKKANELCGKKLTEWLGTNCPHKSVAVPMTNMWREDNDPPCALLPGFVAAWNDAGLRPSLAMTIPSAALTALRKEWGNDAPEFAGEWPDWWVNGAASMPREMSAAREAKRLVEALESPLFDSKDSRKAVDECLHDLCLFDEHTFGSGDSVAFPWNNDSRGNYAAKSTLAYRPLALAEYSAAEAARRCVPAKGAVVHVINPYNKPFTGWVNLTDDCLRGSFEGVMEEETGRQMPFIRDCGVASFVKPADMNEISVFNAARVFPDLRKNKSVMFWVDEIQAGRQKTYRLLEHIKAPRRATCKAPSIKKDKQGWPVGIKWEEGKELKGCRGEFYSLEFGGDFPRWTYKKVFGLRTEDERRRARQSMAQLASAEPSRLGGAFSPRRSLLASAEPLAKPGWRSLGGEAWVAKPGCVPAAPAGKATIHDMGTTILFKQDLRHPRLRFIRKELEVYKAMPRARLKIMFERRPRPESAEIFYLRIPLGMAGVIPIVTNGGIPFIPGKDQLPGSCKDYYGIDGDIVYRTGKKKTVITCRDSALVSFGGMHDGLGLKGLQGDLSDVYAVLFNNIWYTNFAGDESGLMKFEFDIYQSKVDFAGYAPSAFPVVRV